uniref:KIB1-4 beta-propeller domain-containing protein n=1 Tax=Oryza rufipogon TaxID=4529 RepID=A0A0E0RA42_ORYRU
MEMNKRMKTMLGHSHSAGRNRSYDPLDDEDEDASDDLEADHDDESYVWNTTMIKVHKVDLVARMLVEACDLGENVLILGHNQSLCLRADEYPLLKANHVYFSDDRELYIKGCKNGCRDIGVFNLENNCAEEIVKPIFDDSGAVHKYKYSWYTGQMTVSDSPSILAPDELRNFLFNKAIVSSDPSGGNFIVVLIHNPHLQLSIARPGDDKWTWLPPHKDYEDCIFRDGLLYALTSAGEIHEYDLSGPAIARKIVLNKVKGFACENMYIVRGPCGDLLQVWRSYDPLDDEDEDASDDLEADHDDESYVWNTTMIKVHKVDLVARMLVEACDLGENVLILGHNQSLCLRADEYPLLKANHVYFSDDRELYIKGCKNGCRDIGVFNLENNCAEEIVSLQLWSNWPPPVWMTPNARKISLETHSS